MLSREIDLKPLKLWLARNVGNFCALIALLFILSPLFEVLFCLFSKTERIVPFVYYPQIILNWIWPASVILALLALLGKGWHGIVRNIKENPVYLWFGLFALWMAFASAVNGTLSQWMVGDSYRNEPLGLVLCYPLVFLFGATGVDRERREGLAALSACVSIAVGVYSLIYYILVSKGLAFTGRVCCAGIFFNANHYGYYLAINIMLCGGLFAMSSRAAFRLLGLAGLLFNTVVLSYDNTFGAWLACLAAFIAQGTLLFTIHRRIDRRTVTALTLFLAVSALIFMWNTNILNSITGLFTDVSDVLSDSEQSNAAGSGRWILWKFTASRIAEKPIWGYGNEGINAMLEEATGNTRPHNELLQYAVFFGIPSVILYLTGIISVCVRSYKYRKQMNSGELICLIGAFSYFVSSLFGNTMFYTTPFFFIMLGMGYHVIGDSSQ